MRKLLLAALLLAGPATASAAAGNGVSMDFFYDNLGACGTWREVGDYGYCWQPDKVPDDWRPYSDGRWVYTDAGWTWDSAEPYAWAVYHYGRWVQVEDAGWVWAPDTQWGPGWVSWREGKDYVGWAPLPPEARFDPSIAFGAWVDDYYDIGPQSYVFVHPRDFSNEHLNSVFVDRGQNLSIILQTTNVTSITYANKVVSNGGPRFEDMSHLSARPLRRFKLDRRQQSSGSLHSRIEGASLHVFAPVVDAKATAPPKKTGERVDKVVINHGWKNTGSPAQVEQARARMKDSPPPPSGLPPKAALESPDVTLENKPVPAEKPPGPKPEKRVAGDLPPGAEPPSKPRKPDMPVAEEPPVKPGPVERPGSVKPLPGEGEPPSKPGKGGMPKPIDTPPASPGAEPKADEAKPPLPPEEPARPGRHTPPPVEQPPASKPESPAKDKKRAAESKP